jgi:hypothetical protein
MSFFNRALETVKEYKGPLALGAATLGAWGIGTTLDAPFSARFASYIPWALAGAEAVKTYWENHLERGLTPAEKVVAYATGATAFSAMYEGWEAVGPKGIGSGKTYPGMGSATDMIKTVFPTLAIEAGKEYVGNAIRRLRRQNSELQ